MLSCKGATASPRKWPFAMVAPDGGVLVSDFPDRRLARPLAGASVSGSVYVFVDHDDALGVSFDIEPVWGYAGYASSEDYAPYDLAGTVDSEDGQPARPFDTMKLPDGTHDLLVTVTSGDGTSEQQRVRFSVQNGTDWVVPADIHVSTTGSDLGTGAIDDPFLTIQKAIDTAKPGDVICAHAGTYMPDDSLRISSSGTATEPIWLMACPGEAVNVVGTRLTGLQPLVRVSASHWVLKDLSLSSGPYFGLFLEYAEHNHIEEVRSFDHGGSGVHLDRGASYNTFVQVESFDNYDEQTGGSNADGFAVKHHTATGNLFYECGAWNNSDDGFDLLESGPQRIDRSYAYLNGYMSSGARYPDGDGNGFKLGIGEGRWQAGGGHVVTRSVAWKNETWGFNSNNGTKPIYLYNNTAWDNGSENYLFNKAEHVLINNVSFEGRTNISAEVVQERNSWQLGIRDPEFISLDPDSDEFLRLGPASPAVGAGIDVGLEFRGDTPDLGAFQFGD